MAPPPSDPSYQEYMRRQNKGRQFKFLIPLIYAPALPLIRLSLRHRPVLRDRLFTAVLAGAFAHGFYLVYLPGASRSSYTSNNVVGISTIDEQIFMMLRANESAEARMAY